jgi:predicted dehydrogenase
MSERKARVAVLGTGWRSTFAHIPGLLNNPDAELVAIADVSQAALDKTIAKYGPLGPTQTTARCCRENTSTGS